MGREQIFTVSVRNTTALQLSIRVRCLLKGRKDERGRTAFIKA